MTTTQYRNFVTVAECRSITGAARELLIAQPALTNQIKRMEDELGVSLFVRYPRSVELTDAGKIFYQAAKSILQIEENTCIEIENLSTGGGTLRMGITLFMPDPSFREMLHAYYQKYPDVAVSLYEENTDDLLAKLEAGIIELAIVVSPKRLPPSFRVIAASDSHLYACRTADSPYLTHIPNGQVIDLTDLKDIPISAPRTLYRYIEEFCHREGFIPIWKAISDSRHATLQLAESGNMVAVLGMHEQALASSGMICNRIFGEDLINQRYLVMLQGRALSTTAQNFINILDSDSLGI